MVSGGVSVAEKSIYHFRVLKAGALLRISACLVHKHRTVLGLFFWGRMQNSDLSPCHRSASLQRKHTAEITPRGSPPPRKSSLLPFPTRTGGHSAFCLASTWNPTAVQRAGRAQGQLRNLGALRGSSGLLGPGFPPAEPRPARPRPVPLSGRRCWIRRSLRSPGAVEPPACPASRRASRGKFAPGWQSAEGRGRIPLPAPGAGVETGCLHLGVGGRGGSGCRRAQCGLLERGWSCRFSTQRCAEGNGQSISAGGFAPRSLLPGKLKRSPSSWSSSSS